MEEKDSLVLLLRNNNQLLKDKLKQKDNNPGLSAFYEQQLIEKEQLITVGIFRFKKTKIPNQINHFMLVFNIYCLKIT